MPSSSKSLLPFAPPLLLLIALALAFLTAPSTAAPVKDADGKAAGGSGSGRLLRAATLVTAATAVAGVAPMANARPGVVMSTVPNDGVSQWQSSNLMHQSVVPPPAGVVRRRTAAVKRDNVPAGGMAPPYADGTNAPIGGGMSPNGPAMMTPPGVQSGMSSIPQGTMDEDSWKDCKKMQQTDQTLDCGAEPEKKKTFCGLC